MRTVSASELQRNFGLYKEMAQREPVTVTSNGRESVVLISADEYKDLKEGQRRVLHVSELSEEELQEMEKIGVPSDGAEFNDEYEH